MVAITDDSLGSFSINQRCIYRTFAALCKVGIKETGRHTCKMIFKLSVTD